MATNPGEHVKPGHAEAPVPERTDFQKHYLEAVRGWHRFDMHRIGRDPSDEPVLDIDVAPPGASKVYPRIEDVRSDLEDLAGDVPPDEPNWELVAATAASNVTFLRAQAGEEFGFEDYVEGTLSFRPGPVKAGEIEESAAKLDEILGYGGLGYDSGSREKYYEEFVLRDNEAIRRAVAGGVAEARRRADGFLAEPPGLDLEPEYVSKDYHGVSELTMDHSHNLRWTVNLMPERHPLDRGRINTLGAHEITGHGYHILSLERSILGGGTNPVLGATAMHMPYAFQAEALAQNAEFMFLDNSWHNVARALYNEHVGLVLYDAQWRVNHGEDPQAVFDGLKREDSLPFEPDAYYGPEFLEAMRDHPLYRAYLASYRSSLKALRPLRGSDPEQQRQAVNTLYDTAMTPQRIAALAASA